MDKKDKHDIKLHIFTSFIFIFIVIGSLEINEHKDVNAINLENDLLNSEDHKYKTFDDPDLDIIFQYPFKWNKYEYKDYNIHQYKHLRFLQDTSRVISFEITNKDGNQYKIDQNQKVQLENPVITINTYKLENPSLSLHEYVKIQNNNIQSLFSDFKLNVDKNYSITIDGIKGWKSEYSINLDKYNIDNINYENIRKMMIIWMIKEEMVYEITYIENEKQYDNNILKIQKLIESIRFKT